MRRMGQWIWRKHRQLDSALDKIALIFIIAVFLSLLAVPLAYRIGILVSAGR